MIRMVLVWQIKDDSSQLPNFSTANISAIQYLILTMLTLCYMLLIMMAYINVAGPLTML